MINDLTLIKLFLSDREIYNNYSPYIRTDALTREGRIIFADIGAFFIEVEGGTEEQFITWFHQIRHRNLSEVQHELYQAIFKRLATVELEQTEEFLKAVINHFRELDLKEKILNNIQDRNFSVNDLKNIIEDYDQEPQIDDDDLDELYEPEHFLAATDRRGGLKWRLHCLEKSLKGLVKGDFGVIAAPVNAGKSSLLISESVNFAGQLTEGCVLFFTTEQTRAQVLKRIWASALQISSTELTTDKKNQDRYSEFMHGDKKRIRVFDGNGLYVHHLRQKIKKYKPKLVIIDMLDHIGLKGSTEMADWRALQKLYHSIRMLARECPILGSSQCSADTEGTVDGQEWYQHYIPLRKLEGSKRGKQGAVDFLITVGHDPKFPKTRYINVAKEKNNSPIQSEVIFDAETSTFTDYKFGG